MATIGASFMNSFTSKLEEPVRQHLKSVYACLTMSTMAASTGAYLQMAYSSYFSAGFLTVLGAMGCLLTLMFTPDNGKNRLMRVGLLLGFAFCSGLGMGPLISIAIAINPSIIVTALTCTSLIFVSFSIASMTANRGYWLFLGGTLMTLLSTIILLSFANIFFASQLVFQVNLYIGLAVMCGFVLYDTQMIIEKRRNGDKDFVTHSVDLFIDLIGIFKRILIILMEKEAEKSRDKKK
uniref:Bax inhibitor 1 n=1 Tax=Clastoptera arizonana TaxID=38151 RepID=A0A1B6DQD0_9HEMI